MLEKIKSAFREHYGKDPDYIVRSPGRVNLIGEHTDYNDGFALPMAIDFSQWLAFSPNQTGQINLFSADIQKQGAFSATDFSEKKDGWLRYAQGIAWQLTQAGHKLDGFDGLLLGNLPIGAGLSSSAALDLVMIKAFSVLHSIPWDPKQMAFYCKKSDNHWVGINNGIMDQLVCAMAEKDKALLIDCRSLETGMYEIPMSTMIVVMNTMTRHSLVDSGYNQRFQECIEAARFFGKTSLRDVSLGEFEAHEADMDAVLRRRSYHVLTENLRTLEAAKSMLAHDPVRLGKLMNESHESLKRDFEVSCEELDIMVEEAQKQPGCYGARMTGGGFGGSAIALIDREAKDAFIENMRAIYEKRTGIKPHIFATEANQGTSLEYP